MKNKLFSKSPTILCVLFVVSLFFLHACKKDLFISSTQGTLSVKEAKDFFSNQILPNSPLTLKAKNTNNPDLSKINHLLYKEPLWEEAREEKVDDGVALAIPIKFLYKNHLILGPNTKINFEELNYLLIKKDNAGKMHANWITKIPDKEYINNNKLGFIGHTVVQDWDGNFEKDFLYEKNGRITEYQKVEKVSQNKNQMFTKTGGSWINLTQKVSLSNTMSEIDGDITTIDTTGIKTPADTLVTSLPVYAIANIKYQDINGNCWVNLAQIGYSSPDGGGVTLYRMQVDCGNTSSGGGGGTSGSGSNTIPNDPYMPGQDHQAINIKDYTKCFENIPNAGASYKISVQVQEPFENSDWNYGKNGVGHTAITLTKTGSNGESITQTIGFYPADNKFVGPSKIVDNATNDPINFTIQMNFDLGVNGERFNSIINYISNPPKIYELMGMNCTYFINEACKKGGIALPSAWSNIAGFMDPLNVARVMTPAGLAQSLRNLKNNGDNRIKTNPGKAPLGKGSCK